MSDTFNLDAYLTRIGYGGPRTASLSTLQAMHALQPAAIPFESLDPFLRRPVRLDLGSLQAKLVGERRGGYCFELNTLFASALRELGFSVTDLAARVRWMAPPERPVGPRSHHLLRVDLEEGAYLADVGFGGHLIASAIRLVPNVEQATPASLLRLIPSDQAFILQSLLPEKGWQDLYWFTLEPQLAIDYEVANWFTSTSPSSRFYADFLAERLTPERRLSLFNNRVTERRSGGGAERRTLANADEFAEILDKGLGITAPADPAEIWNRLPKS